MHKAMAERCRLCTANDREALVEQLAITLYQSRIDPMVDPTWDHSGMWQTIMRDFAETSLHILEHGHG
jgi:hypothetical protein